MASPTPSQWLLYALVPPLGDGPHLEVGLRSEDEVYGGVAWRVGRVDGGGRRHHPAATAGGGVATTNWRAERSHGEHEQWHVWHGASPIRLRVKPRHGGAD